MDEHLKLEDFYGKPIVIIDAWNTQMIIESDGERYTLYYDGYVREGEHRD